MFQAIRMPKLSNCDQYQITKFHRGVGDVVKQGELFLDVVAEDGTPLQAGFYLSGKITEINAKIGDTVREDSLLGVMATE